MSSFTNVFHWPKNSVFERPSKITDSRILGLNNLRAPDHSEHMNTRGCFTKITKTSNKKRNVMHLLQKSFYFHEKPTTIRKNPCLFRKSRKVFELVI